MFLLAGVWAVLVGCSHSNQDAQKYMAQVAASAKKLRDPVDLAKASAADSRATTAAQTKGISEADIRVMRAKVSSAHAYFARVWDKMFREGKTPYHPPEVTGSGGWRFPDRTLHSKRSCPFGEAA